MHPFRHQGMESGPERRGLAVCNPIQAKKVMEADRGQAQQTPGASAITGLNRYQQHPRILVLARGCGFICCADRPVVPP